MLEVGSPILTIQQLSVSVGTHEIVKGVSFDVPKGRIIAVVGASGSGKTTLGLAILNLLPQALRVTQGRILFEGQGMLNDSNARQARGARIGMVFQEPLHAFNPLMRLGAQLDEVVRAHMHLDNEQRRRMIIDMLSLVELPNPQHMYNSYPHELSGGMRQRAMIAQALVCEPSLLIADEPTSNLDSLAQAKIMALFRKLKNELNLTMILITHDLSMVARLADEVVVLNLGNMVEHGQVSDIMTHPKHPYTQSLIEACS